jgi:hypothetical protein
MSNLQFIREALTVRAILDTNLWSSIGDEGVTRPFDDLMGSRSLQVVVPPSILIEVLAHPLTDVRQRIIDALATGPRHRLPTEAQSESSEVVAEVRRVRPHWMRSMPDTAKVWSLNNFWTNKIWREVLEDSEPHHSYRMREQKKYEYLVKQQRSNRTQLVETNFQIRPLTAILVSATPEAPESYLAGWSGGPVDAWRVTSRDLYWHELRVISGRAVITKEDTTYADWIGSDVDLSRLRSDHVGFTRLWLEDIEPPGITSPPQDIAR